MGEVPLLIPLKELASACPRTTVRFRFMVVMWPSQFR